MWQTNHKISNFERKSSPDCTRLDKQDPSTFPNRKYIKQTFPHQHPRQLLRPLIGEFGRVWFPPSCLCPTFSRINIIREFPMTHGRYCVFTECTFFRDCMLNSLPNIRWWNRRTIRMFVRGVEIRLCSFLGFFFRWIFVMLHMSEGLGMWVCGVVDSAILLDERWNSFICFGDLLCPKMRRKV